MAALDQFVDANGLTSGDKLLSERELAQHLGVSRSSVREALAALRSRGVVESRHGEGVFLLRGAVGPAPPPGLAVRRDQISVDLPYIWETRQALESQCARVAASRAGEEDLRFLDEALAVMGREIEQGLPGHRGDRMFHLGVARASHNPILIDLVESIAESLDRTSAQSLCRPGQPRRSLSDHVEILAAIRSHEPGDAGDAMLFHLIRTTDPMLEAHATETGRLDR